MPITDTACQKEFDSWQAGEKQWRDNRRIYANYFTYKGRLIPHVRRPDPPWWIQHYCEQEHADPATIRPSVVCEAYDEYLRYDWTQHIEGPQSAVTYSSRVTQGGLGDYRGFAEFLLRNLHYDGGWTTGPNGSQAYGLFGTHLTLARAGRVHLWGPPGMLVVRRPERKIEVKMTWGVDVFLAELPLPFGSHRLPLYVSFAKVFGAPEQQALQHKVNAGLDMLGFSVTLKR